jgi:hypothetical protein
MRRLLLGIAVLAASCGEQFSAESGTAGAAGASGSSGSATGSDAGATGGAAGLGGAASGGAGGVGGTGGKLLTGGSGGTGATGGKIGTGGSGAVDAATILSSCGKQYGAVQFYKLCMENATECHVMAANMVQSCKVVCGSNGGECLDAYDNVDTDPTCGHSTQSNCDFTGWYEIVCVCSKGCGSGPPCKYPSTCLSGTCS